LEKGSMIPTIACIFRHTTTLDCDRAALLAGLQTYVDEHLGPVWLKGARVVLKAGADEGDWPLYFLDDADQAGALGYHTDPDGAGPKPPMGFVFVRTAIVDGNPVSFVASHELAEMLVDPGCNLGALTPRGRWAALEVCDPVEREGFILGGLIMANFVYPAWFGQPGSRFDHGNTCQHAYEIRPGGYLPVWLGGRWMEVFADGPGAIYHAARDKRLRRSGRRRLHKAGAVQHPGGRQTAHSEGGPGGNLEAAPAPGTA